MLKWFAYLYAIKGVVNIDVYSKCKKVLNQKWISMFVAIIYTQGLPGCPIISLSYIL